MKELLRELRPTGVRKKADQRIEPKPGMRPNLGLRRPPLTRRDHARLLAFAHSAVTVRAFVFGFLGLAFGPDISPIGFR